VFVGNTRCGIASIRRTGSFYGYTIAVAGPDSIAGCERGAPLTFRINGWPWTPSTRCAARFARLDAALTPNCTERGATRALCAQMRRNQQRSTDSGSMRLALTPRA
jgi:hypothetical protein